MWLFFCIILLVSKSWFLCYCRLPLVKGASTQKKQRLKVFGWFVCDFFITLESLQSCLWPWNLTLFTRPIFFWDHVISFVIKYILGQSLKRSPCIRQKDWIVLLWRKRREQTLTLINLSVCDLSTYIYDIPN